MGLTVTVLIENTYGDGHESTATHVLAAPDPAYLDDWWDEVVWELTGDGHDIAGNLGSCYTATITDGPRELVGQSQEWLD